MVFGLEFRVQSLELTQNPIWFGGQVFGMKVVDSGPSGSGFRGKSVYALPCGVCADIPES